MNDKRTFGDYVGHHGKVMEKDLPVETTVAVRRKAGHVYDLVAHKQVEAQSADDSLRLNVSMAPGGGKLFMITTRPIGKVSIDAPDSAQRGQPVELNATIGDEAGEAIDAVIPLRQSRTQHPTDRNRSWRRCTSSPHQIRMPPPLL